MNQDLPKRIEMVEHFHKMTEDYLIKLKSAFYCTVCDFTNHKHFKIPQKIVRMSPGACSDIAENTINFSYLLNVIVAPYLMRLTKILALFSNGDEPIKIRTFKQIYMHVNQCYNAFRSGGDLANPCKNYCNYYNINSYSPIIEGYQVFLNDLWKAFSRFLKHTGVSLPEKKNRKLKQLIY